MTVTQLLRTTEAFSGFAVPNIEAARSFYADTLGVDVREEHGMLTLELGETSVMVYPKPEHEPAVFTILNFPVTDIDAAVDELVEAGVEFEQYDGEMATDEKGIFRGSEHDAGPDIAWFRDPAGNIMALIEM